MDAYEILGKPTQKKKHAKEKLKTKNVMNLQNQAKKR